MNRKYRKTLIAGNWKMNKTPTQTKAFMTELKGLLPKGRWCDIALCVPAVCIPAAVRAMRETRVAIGAENCNAHTSGAYTGEIAAVIDISYTDTRTTFAGDYFIVHDIFNRFWRHTKTVINYINMNERVFFIDRNLDFTIIINSFHSMVNSIFK